MKDEELEALLTGTRPKGPSWELRARILARRRATGTTRSAWPWAAVAAALLIVTLLLQTAAAGLRHQVRDATTAFAPDIEDELTVAWRDAGGFSEDEARLLAMVHQMQMRIEQNRPAEERPEP
jgi:hypothetical protein